MAKTSPSDRLLTDLHQVVTEAESLLRATADQTSAGASELRARVPRIIYEYARKRLTEQDMVEVGSRCHEGLRADEVVLDVGTGVGVLVPLIDFYRPALILACDLAERMLARLHTKHPQVLVVQADITLAPFASSSVDAIFMNAMFGNIAAKPTNEKASPAPQCGPASG